MKRPIQAVVHAAVGGSSAQPTDAFLAEINSLLIQYFLRTPLRKQYWKAIREMSLEPRKPSDLWAPIIDATADLLANAEASRIRKCESCVAAHKRSVLSTYFGTARRLRSPYCVRNGAKTPTPRLLLRSTGAGLEGADNNWKAACILQSIPRRRR
jgi:hypothetical protein